jgi:hypothetical protein
MIDKTERQRILKKILENASQASDTKPGFVIHVSHALAKAVEKIIMGMEVDLVDASCSPSMAQSIILELYQHLMVRQVLRMINSVSDMLPDEPKKTDEELDAIGMELRDLLVDAFMKIMEKNLKNYSTVVFDPRREEQSQKQEWEDADTTS